MLGLFVTQQSLAANITLEDFLSRVKNQSLDDKIQQARYDSFQAKASGYLIPPPTLSFSRFKEQDSATSNGFEILQTIPFPSHLTADHAARKYDFLAQKELQVSAQKQTLITAKILYLTLWQNQMRAILLDDKKHIIQHHIKIARSAARSDSFGAIHLLKAESDLDLLESDIEIAQQNAREKQFEMATLIGVDPATYSIEAVEPSTTEMPATFSIEGSHLYKTRMFKLQALKEREIDAKANWFPDFSLKYKEMGSTSTAPKSVETMIGITLPFLFFWEPNSLVRQAKLESLQGQFEFDKEKRNFLSDKSVLFSRIKSLRKQLDTLNTRLIPRAEKRKKLLQNISLRDMEALQDHRDTMEALPDLKMKALDYRLDYEKAVAEVVKYNADED